MLVDASANRAQDLAARFEREFALAARVYRAPGRVNLIGEHTDYNDGFVTPAAIGFACYVAAAPRTDRRIVIESENVGERVEWSLDDPDPARRSTWSPYVLGVAALLRRRDSRLQGASLLLNSTVPIGAGLSSSAALEVAVTVALSDLSGIEISRLDVARLCQQSEIEFVGARCGIMDQFVACHGRSGYAILLDCRSLEHREVPLPRGVRIVACNTMVRHTHASGEYNQRRAECEAGVACIAARFPDVNSLRDVDMNRLDACRADLRDTIFKRCRHVVSEDVRTRAFVSALEHARLDELGALMAASHHSLRDDYAVSCDELDVMVEIARDQPGVLGTRMTGGGFGGCTVALVRDEAVGRFEAEVAQAYRARTGKTPDIYVMDAGDGAARVL